MTFYADLHIHSKYSRATSRHCDLEHLALWAQKKGIRVIGTGDFTHPAWRATLRDTLIPAEPGLFRLPPERERAIASRLPRACHSAPRFMLSVEISTIYKKGERTRKIHHLLYAPDFACAERIVQRLAAIGNLASDGRPILGLDSRHVLEIVLEAGAGAYLVPAHIWTPWFAALGSKSGFDAIDDCYADLAPHIFAVETGLSSDPPMNWRVSSLDRFRLVSNSDAHSPEKLGREACVFDTDLDYFAIRRALETGQGYAGTVEFFPEEGKYHLDGHRNCNVCLAPPETRQYGGRCPVCGKPLTIGVMHRVEELADRTDNTPPPTAGRVQSLVPLPEVLAELLRVGPKSKSVSQQYERLLDHLGPELALLTDVPLEDIRREGSSLLAEAIMRLRNQQVIREAGFDGAYGTIRLFQTDELLQHTVAGSLFDTSADHRVAAPSHMPPVEASYTARQNTTPSREAIVLAESASSYDATFDTPVTLDADQRRAVEILTGPLLIVAGPGSGKTRTLTQRMVHLIRRHGVPAAHCLAITFTRRAADEMRQRLRLLLPDLWAQIPIMTFHALGLAILQEHWNTAGLQRGFRIASEPERLHLLRDALEVSASQARRFLAAISLAKRTRTRPEEERLAQALTTYRHVLDLHNLVDFDDLVRLAADVLEADPEIRSSYQQRYPYVSIDEYQDVDEQQVRLIKALVPPHGNVCAIGDPDQAIYGFRGADVRFFTRFAEDFPGTQIVRLTRNYRSGRTIVAAACQVITRPGVQPQAIAMRNAETRRITLHEAATERAEAEFVVQTIEHLLGGHSFFSIDSGRSTEPTSHDVSFADIAVLYRTEAQAPALIEALHRSGMPFQQHSHRPLLDHPGVPRLLNLLHQQAGEGSVLTQLTAVAEHGEPQAESQEAFMLLQPLAAACGENLERFLAELSLGIQVDTRDPRADRLSLLTLHAAKGLEFPVVFIVGCEAGILPLTWGQTTQADLDEERRLFYVGLTRAQTHLYLCHARRRLWRGQIQAMARSPYLDDIEEQLLERHQTQRREARPQASETQLTLF